MEDLTHCLHCGEELPPYHKVGPRRKYCNRTECNAQGRLRVTTTIHIKKRQWSKWGGVNRVIQHNQVEDIWCCQACGKDQPKEMPAYKFPFFGEFLRICSLCHNTVMKEGITDFSLLREIRG